MPSLIVCLDRSGMPDHLRSAIKERMDLAGGDRTAAAAEAVTALIETYEDAVEQLRRDLAGRGIQGLEPQEMEVERPAEVVPQQTQAVTPAANGPIVDVGEKIGGARKDRITVDDLERMSSEERQALVKRRAVWSEPEAQDLMDAGMPREVAWMVLRAYGGIATEPVIARKAQDDPVQRDAAIRAYVETVGRLRDRLLAVRSEADVLAALKAEWPALYQRGMIGDYTGYYADRDRYRIVARSSRLANAHAARREMHKAMAEGWPHRAPWQRWYRVQSTTRVMEDGSRRETWYVRARSVDRSRGEQDLRDRWFDTQEGAEAEAARRYEQVVKASGGKEPTRPLNPDAVRVGEQRRDGDRDIAADELRNAFGFRGVEFGNWANQADRQQAINQAYDGLMDLAERMGIPPRALSFDGALGIAFGSRGGGRSAAHYEPGKVVINLTRTRGSGSLAHEWAHAVDNLFGKMGSGGRIDAYGSQANARSVDPQGKAGIRQEMVDAWKRVRDAIVRDKDGKPSTYLRESERADRKRKEPYWSEHTELFARAFEVWLAQRIEQDNAASPYLVKGVPTRPIDLSAATDWERLYPLNEDAQRIGAAIGAWASALTTEETPDGQVRLYQKERTPGDVKNEGILQPYDRVPYVNTPLSDLLSAINLLRDEQKLKTTPVGALAADLMSPGLGGLETQALLRGARARWLHGMFLEDGGIIRPGKSHDGSREGFEAGSINKSGEFSRRGWGSTPELAAANAVHAQPADVPRSVEVARNIIYGISNDPLIIKHYGTIDSEAAFNAINSVIRINYLLNRDGLRSIAKDVISGRITSLEDLARVQWDGVGQVKKMLEERADRKREWEQAIEKSIDSPLYRTDVERAEEDERARLADSADRVEEAVRWYRRMRRKDDLEEVFVRIPQAIEDAVNESDSQERLDHQRRTQELERSDMDARSMRQREVVRFWKDVLDRRDAGPVALFWIAYAKTDDGFQHNRSKAKTLRGIGAAYGVDCKWDEDEDGDLNVSGKNGSLTIVGAKGDAPVVRSTDAGSSGKKAGGGVSLYQAAYHWAFVNHTTIHPDTSLSYINVLRKTSAMLSTGLRFHSLQHVLPSPEQGVSWKGEFYHDIGALALRELELVQQRFPGFDHLLLDENGDIMRRHDDGSLERISTQDAQDSLVASGTPGETGVGMATLVRALCTRRVLEASREAHDDRGIKGTGAPIRPVVKRRLLYQSDTTPGEQPRASFDREPGGREPVVPVAPVTQDLEGLIRWVLRERERTIADLERRAAASADPQLAQDYRETAREYRDVDPDDLARSMRQHSGHYIRQMSNQGGNRDAVHVFHEMEREPPAEERIQPLPTTAGPVPDLRESIATLMADLRRASPGAPALSFERGRPGEAGGFYDPASKEAVLKYHNDLDLVAHEIAHWAETEHGLTAGQDEAALRQELARFGLHGSPAVGETLLHEGWAEVLRAWMVNPGAAALAAPHAVQRLEGQLPQAVQQALRAYGDRVRRFAGGTGAERIQSGQRGTTAAAMAEVASTRWYRLFMDGLLGLFGASGKRKRQGGTVPAHFAAAPADRLRFTLTDKEAPQLANYVASLLLAGKDPDTLTPSEDWRILRQMARGQSGRLRDMVLEHGLARYDLTPEVDERTGHRLTVPWLLETILEAGGDGWTQLLDAAHAYGTAQRAVELAARFERETQRAVELFEMNAAARKTGRRLSEEETAELLAYMRRQGRRIDWQQTPEAFGVQERAFLRRRLARLIPAGGGIDSAMQAARDALAELAQHPQRQAIEEYLRRYRRWADFNLGYLADAELMSPEQVEGMRSANEFYIDWHRVFGDDDAPINVGEAVTGSMRTIHNPLASLLHATWSAVKRGDANRLLLAFTAPLRLAQTPGPGKRSMGGLGHQLGTEDADEAWKHGGYHDNPGGQEGERQQRVYRLHRLVATEEGKPPEVVTEHWVFDSGTEASMEAMRTSSSDHPWMQLMEGLNQLQRAMIVLSPSFRLKVPVRDNVERLVVSEVGSGVGEIPEALGDPDLDGRGLRELFSLTGAGMAGWNSMGRDKALSEVFAEVQRLRSSGVLVLTPSGLWRAWQRFGEEAENLARRAEFLAAYRLARKPVSEGGKGYGQRDAALYAMTQARGLLDTAESGNLIGKMNGITFFLNAGIKGVQRNTKLIRAAMKAFAEGDHEKGMRIGGVVAVRMLMLGGASALLRWLYLASLRDEDREREALREPAWKRDFAWRFDVGGLKIAIPKPYEAGWVSSGFDRLVDAAWARNKGWKEDAARAMEGYGKSFLGAVLPINPMHGDALSGSFLPLVEVLTNYDLFRQGHIVPAYEEGKDVALREGTRNASPLGRLLQTVSGDRLDARAMDHLVRGYFGGFGAMATARDAGEVARRGTGYAGSTSLYSSRDVEWVLDWADAKGLSNRAAVRGLRKQLRLAQAATGPTADSARASALRLAALLRNQIEKNPKAWGGERE